MAEEGTLIKIIASFVIGILILLIVGTRFFTMAENGIDENDTEAIENLGQQKSMFYVVLGLLTIVPIALTGKVLMDLF